jgi:hypothetical protein
MDTTEVRCFTHLNLLMHNASAPQDADASQDPEVLARRESELKERALRNKVVRTRKRTTSNPDSA